MLTRLTISSTKSDANVCVLGCVCFFQFLENQETMVSIAVQNRIYDRLQPTRVSEMSSKKVRRKVGNFKLKLKRIVSRGAAVIKPVVQEGDLGGGVPNTAIL